MVKEVISSRPSDVQVMGVRRGREKPCEKGLSVDVERRSYTWNNHRVVEPKYEAKVLGLKTYDAFMRSWFEEA